jgi:hypothetical protein
MQNNTVLPKYRTFQLLRNVRNFSLQQTVHKKRSFKYHLVNKDNILDQPDVICLELAVSHLEKAVLKNENKHNFF